MDIPFYPNYINRSQFAKHQSSGADGGVKFFELNGTLLITTQHLMFEDGKSIGIGKAGWNLNEY